MAGLTKNDRDVALARLEVWRQVSLALITGVSVIVVAYMVVLALRAIFNGETTIADFAVRFFSDGKIDLKLVSEYSPWSITLAALSYALRQRSLRRRAQGLTKGRNYLLSGSFQSLLSGETE